MTEPNSTAIGVPVFAGAFFAYVGVDYYVVIFAGLGAIAAALTANMLRKDGDAPVPSAWRAASYAIGSFLLGAVAGEAMHSYGHGYQDLSKFVAAAFAFAGPPLFQKLLTPLSDALTSWIKRVFGG
jgi:hypothetical protein